MPVAIKSDWQRAVTEVIAEVERHKTTSARVLFDEALDLDNAVL